MICHACDKGGNESNLCHVCQVYLCSSCMIDPANHPSAKEYYTGRKA